jgi:hypothetical protein
MSGISPPEMGQAFERPDLPEEQSDAPEPEEERDTGSGTHHTPGDEPHRTAEPAAPGIEHGSEPDPDQP